MMAILSLSLKHKTCNSGLFLIVDKSWQTNKSTITRGDCTIKSNNKEVQELTDKGLPLTFGHCT